MNDFIQYNQLNWSSNIKIILIYLEVFQKETSLSGPRLYIPNQENVQVTAELVV